MTGARAMFVAFLAVTVLGGMVACRPTAEPTATTPADSGTAAVAAGVPTGAVPSGVIVAFYGTIVPEGWVLCDGRTTARGVTTPDLRDRFILGLDPSTGAVGERGGAASHTHTAQTGKPREKDENIESGNDEHAANDGHTHDVKVDAAQHLPPYVKLAYIMKE